MNLSSLQDHDIVCISSTYWDDNWLSGHQYMSRIAKNNRVLYVEKPITPLSIIATGQKQRAIPQFKRWLGGGIRKASEISDTFYIGSPPPILPMRFESPIILINQIIRRLWVRHIIKKLNFENPVLWIYDPDAFLMLGHLNEKFTIYAITDDHATNGSSYNRERLIRHWEAKLIEHSDLVLATTQKLAYMKKSYNENTHYIPHGVDYDLFSKTLSDDTEIAPELKQLDGSLVGVVGLIDERLDTLLIYKMATQHPEWHIVFVGPIHRQSVDLTSIESLANVHFLGQKPKDILPHYLKPMSVCIIPYKLNEHTQYMHPLKTLEYLAAGKAVVSINLPTLSEYEYLQLVNEHETFIKAIEEEIATDSGAKQNERNQYSLHHTWEKRVEVIDYLVGETSYL